MNKLKLYLMLLPLLGCGLGDYADEERALPDIGINNALVYQTEYLGHIGNQMKVAVDFGVLYSGEALDNKFLPDTIWKSFSQGAITMDVDEVQRIAAPEPGSYSNLIAIDQSDDWNSFDAFNLRTTSLYKGFVEAEQYEQNEVALGAFTRGFNGTSAVYTYVKSIEDGRTAFEQNAQEKGEILYQLYDRVGASSNVYDAIDKYLDYVDVFANNSNRQVTLLCVNPPDFDNSVTSGTLISKAQSLGIKVNIVMLGSSINWLLANIATRTGGYINIISSTEDYNLTLGGIMDKGNSVLAGLHKLSEGTLHRYRVIFNVTQSTSNWVSGNVLYSRYQVNAKYSDGDNRLNNYLPIYVQVP